MIGIFDSGLGGLSIYKEIKKILPNERIIYIADQANFPFGNKSKEDLLRISKNNTKLLIQNECNLIVTACNTITVSLIDELRKEFPVVFVGVVPAIRLAAELTKNNKVGVLATKGTIANSYLDFLIEKHDLKCEVLKISGENLIEKIEKFPAEVTDEDLEDSLKKIMDADTIVLGCTHFHFFLERFQSIFPDKNFIDSGLGVAAQVKRVLERENHGNKDDNKTDKFFSSGDLESFKKSLACFNIEAKEVYGI